MRCLALNSLLCSLQYAEPNLSGLLVYICVVLEQDSHNFGVESCVKSLYNGCNKLLLLISTCFFFATLFGLAQRAFFLSPFIIHSVWFGKRGRNCLFNCQILHFARFYTKSNSMTTKYLSYGKHERLPRKRIN